MNDILIQSNLSIAPAARGKVRDVYHVSLKDGTPATLLAASDRISAYDVVMPTPIPGKGRLLTQMSLWWFDHIGEKLGNQIQHHILDATLSDVSELTEADVQSIEGRTTLGRRCEVVPIECVVRGYLAGSGWKSYQQTSEVCGVSLPAGLKQCDRLPEPIFTPATKAESGHDENISFEVACEHVGQDVMEKLRDASLAIYKMAHAYAAERGILLADTKFEFGYPVDASGKRTGEPILIDEVLTPDSSRYWPADEYQPGQDQPSFDKQFVRNHLESLVAQGQWDKQPPGPDLPDNVVLGTMQKYQTACDRLTAEAD